MELQFRGELWYWRGPAPFHVVSVPDEECGALEAASSLVSYGWGMIPARARIGATAFRTALFPKDGGYGKDPAAPHRSHARVGPLQQGRPAVQARAAMSLPRTAGLHRREETR